MATVTAIFLMGCSLCPTQIKTEYIEPKAFKFVPIDVNVTEIKEIKPFNLNGKIKFTDDTNSSVKMSVKSWIAIREVNRQRTKAVLRLRLHEKMYRKALDAVNEQIRLYLKTRNNSKIE